MKTVLVVEDNKDYRDLLVDKLKSAGLNVVIAENGQKALDIVITSSVDLILLDIIMPGMDGMTFFNHLSKTTTTIPVIILTNLSEAAYPYDVKKFLIKANTSLDQVVSEVKAFLPL